MHSLQLLQIIRGLTHTITIMNPLKCKKQWEKQWTRGKDPSQRRHPRSLSGSDMGTSSSSSMSSSPSPQYSPEIPQMDNLTELNSPSDILILHSLR